MEEDEEDAVDEEEQMFFVRNVIDPSEDRSGGVSPARLR